MRMGTVRVVLVGASLLVASSYSFGASPEQTAVMAVMHGMFDKPGPELVIEPVIVEGSFAVADWIQGDMGGRAFLKQAAGKWNLVLCAGDEIRSAEALKESGVPAGTAERLAASIVEAERTVSPDRLKKFASFQGTVRMDGHAGN